MLLEDINKSGTIIYFRTLDDWWESSRWLTLKNIIIDEAQLIDDYVFDDVLEPTIATTNGRMTLIWTASKHKKYFYKQIQEAKKLMQAEWISFNQNLIWVKVWDYL